MAKKAKRVSWRTLMRQADKERVPRKATALRNQAAELRRSERAMKRKKVKKAAPAARRNIAGAKRAAQGWATRRANELARAVGDSPEMRQIRDQVQNATTVGPALSQAKSYSTTDSRGAPGQGEIVGGAFSQLADRVAKLARKKGGSDDIQNELAALAASSKYEGCVETDKAATKRLIEVQEIIADRIVCGFLAEMEHAMKFHRGFPPGMVLSVDAHIITKIIDALNKAGYRATGKT